MAPIRLRDFRSNNLTPLSRVARRISCPLSAEVGDATLHHRSTRKSHALHPETFTTRHRGDCKRIAKRRTPNPRTVKGLWQESYEALENEGIEWLSEYFNCEVVPNDTNKYSPFDCVLYNSLRGSFLEPEEMTPWAYAEVKARTISKGYYVTFLLDLRKLTFARSILPLPCYLVVVWTDFFGLLELSKITDDQITIEVRTVESPIQGRVEKEIVLVPTTLFYTEPRTSVCK